MGKLLKKKAQGGIERKLLSIKEFQKGGYLQEVNRLFFHPLGLALAIEVDEEKDEYRLKEIWDARDYPEGFVFVELKKDYQTKVEAERRAKISARVDLGCCDNRGVQCHGCMAGRVEIEEAVKSLREDFAKGE